MLEIPEDTIQNMRIHRFNNRENDGAYYMFRSYNNCYYSSSEPVTDEEDLYIYKVIYTWYNSSIQIKKI